MGRRGEFDENQLVRFELVAQGPIRHFPKLIEDHEG